ncbi:high nitrogen upregulated cytochrome P450 monooxygenase 2 [Abortiporus biennis]|nr:high nitrogen upregulated cytochrome P450 monooxygenase 2 [Abortiporus biennis]
MNFTTPHYRQQNMIFPLLHPLYLHSSVTFTSVPACALITHLIFKYKEPFNPIIYTVTLLAVLPSILSGLLAQELHSIAAIPLTFIAFYSILALSIVGYRLSPFHPLSSYPGPIFCKISKLWLYVQAKDGKQHLYIQALHRRYHSDIVRIGPNEVSIIEPDALADVLGRNGVPKAPVTRARHLFPDTKPTLLNVEDLDEHAKQRIPWTRAFSATALKDHEPKVAKRCLQLAEYLSRTSGPINMTHLIRRWSYDLMSDVVYSGGSEILRDGDSQGALKYEDKSISFFMLFEQMPWMAWFARELPFVKAGISHMRKAAFQRAASRIAQEAKTKDLYYYLRNEDTGKDLRPLEDILPESVLATIAGTETVAVASIALFYLVIQRPDVYWHLQAEIDAFYPAGTDPTDSRNYKEMSYLDAVIHETLRLYPAVPSGSVRHLSSNMPGRLLGSHYVPPGTTIRYHCHSVLRDERNFSPHSDKFWPERWLIASGKMPAPESFQHNSVMFIPFSYGPANCVGKHLAFLEIRMVVCTIMQRLNLKYAEGWDPKEWERHLLESFAYESGELRLEVESR